MYEVMISRRDGLNESDKTLTQGTLEECNSYLRGYVAATLNYQGYESVFLEDLYPFGRILRSPLVSAPEITMWIAKSVED